MNGSLRNAFLSLLVISGISLCVSQPRLQNGFHGDYVHDCSFVNNYIEDKPLKLVKPTGGEIFSIGDTIIIVWTYDPDIIGFTAVMVSRDTGRTWQEILQHTQKPGLTKSDSIRWAPADGPGELADRAVMIMVCNYSNTITDQSSLLFISSGNQVVHQSQNSFDDIDISLSGNRITLTCRKRYNNITLSIFSAAGRKIMYVSNAFVNEDFIVPNNYIAGQALVMKLSATNPGSIPDSQMKVFLLY